MNNFKNLYNIAEEMNDFPVVWYFCAINLLSSYLIMQKHINSVLSRPPYWYKCAPATK